MEDKTVIKEQLNNDTNLLSNLCYWQLDTSHEMPKLGLKFSIKMLFYLIVKLGEYLIIQNFLIKMMLYEGKFTKLFWHNQATLPQTHFHDMCASRSKTSEGDTGSSRRTVDRRVEVWEAVELEVLAVNLAAHYKNVNS